MNAESGVIPARPGLDIVAERFRYDGRARIDEGVVPRPS